MLKSVLQKLEQSYPLGMELSYIRFKNAAGELLDFPGIKGIAQFEEDNVGAALFGDDRESKKETLSNQQEDYLFL